MSILVTLEEGINLTRLNGATQMNVLNAFFANYLSSLILLKLQDLRGLMLINDRSHSRLTSFSTTMSDVNFWGRALFCSNEKDVEHRLAPGAGKEIHNNVKTVNIAYVHKIMNVPLTSPDLVNWNEVCASLVMLKFKFKYHSTYFDLIVKTLKNWESLNLAAKQKAVNYAFMFLMQSDSQSKLLNWFRTQSTELMLNNKRIERLEKVQNESRKIVSFSRLVEDEGGGGGEGTSTGNIASNAIVDPSAGIVSRDQSTPEQNLSGMFKLVKNSPYQVTKKAGKYNIRNGKIIVRKTKKFKAKEFKAPDFLKVKKVKKSEKEIENEVK